MCGFAGLVRSDRPIDAAPDLAGRLDAALAHRGPDGRGCWTSSDGYTLLVHRRLAIINPGPDGAQPMATSDGSHQLLFNGEIYNYRELRRDLESRGDRFATAGDTEVLLRLVIRDGPESLSRVRITRSFWRAIGLGSSHCMLPREASRSPLHRNCRH